MNLMSFILARGVVWAWPDYYAESERSATPRLREVYM